MYILGFEAGSQVIKIGGMGDLFDLFRSLLAHWLVFQESTLKT